MKISIRLCSALLTSGVIAGCLDAGRLNDRCELHDDSVFVIDSANDRHRDHLTNDAQVAEANGIRYGDASKQTLGIPVSIRLREECTARLFGVIATNHGIDSTAIRRAAHRRNLLFDGALMWLPAFIGLVIAGRLVARKVCRSFDDEDRVPRMLSLLALTPVVAGFFVGLAQMWSWQVETLRFRDSHMSYRVGRLLTSSHGWYFFAGAAVVFLVIALAEYRRSVTPGSESGALNRWQRR